MSRPRIRTLKPEAPRDERVGRLSRDARLLFFTGLVALADDEGRLRAMPSAIIGDVFPYDDDVTPAKLRRWLSEIEAEQLILRYEADGIQYLAIRHWKRHQRINRPTPSVLPPPPDQIIVTENAVNVHGTDSEDDVKDHEVLTTDSPPRAQARVPFRSVPKENSNDPTHARGAGVGVKYRGKAVPPATVADADATLTAFNDIAGTKYGAWAGNGQPSPALKQIIGALLEHPDVDRGLAEQCCRLELKRPDPYWDAPHVGVVFGPNAFPRILETVRRRGTPSRPGDLAASIAKAYGN